MNKNKIKEKTKHTSLISMVHRFLLHLNNSFQVNQDVRQLDWKSPGIKEEKNLSDCDIKVVLAFCFRSS